MFCNYSDAAIRASSAEFEGGGEADYTGAEDDICYLEVSFDSMIYGVVFDSFCSLFLTHGSIRNEVL